MSKRFLSQFGDSWENPDTCQNCECQEKGEVICVSVICDKCSKKVRKLLDLVEVQFISNSGAPFFFIMAHFLL